MKSQIILSEVELPIISYDIANSLKESLENEDNLFIEEAIKRYKRFIQLAKLYPHTKLVPTVDIDIVWHDHMLHPKSYFNDCANYLGRILDHKPSKKGENLTAYFKNTGELWAEIYNENYVGNYATAACDSGGGGDACSSCYSGE